jgi:hypothetical protein
MKNKVAILQSNYIPWKGYFDIIRSVDLFIFHDDLQYTKGDWRNRNKIKTPNGIKWLTIPCGTNEKRLICEVEITDHSWQKQHWNLIQMSYKKSEYFSVYKSFFEDIFLGENWKNLSDFNQTIIKKISKEILNIDTEFDDSRRYELKEKKGDRVIELLKKANAEYYLSGPAAKDYINEKVFKENNISLEWMDYSNYPEYTQLYPPFEHFVSIIDLIFNEGPNTLNFMKKINSK